MKHKISELESKGIHPDRNNVQPHLNNIKMFTKLGMLDTHFWLYEYCLTNVHKLFFQGQKLAKDLRELQ